MTLRRVDRPEYTASPRGLNLSMWYLFGIVLLSLTCSSWAAEPPAETLITVKTPTGTLIQAELADTALKRAQGLMFREHLADDRGMLFIFGDAQPWTFWMKNTKIPLDIIWMDGKKTIIHIERNVPICTRQDDGCPQYHSEAVSYTHLTLPTSDLV